MADNDLEIRVKSTADLGALKQAKAAVDDLAARTQKINRAAMEADTARFAASTGLPLPGTPTSPFGAAGGAGTTGLTSVAADMERVAQASLLAGVNVSRARNELTTLVREMAAGAPVSRTLGALMGALGFQIAGLGIAMGAPILVASKLIEQEQKLNDELDQQLSHITDLAKQWNDLARSVTTPEGVQNIAKAVVPEIQKANKAVTDFAKEGIPWYKRALDSLTNLGGFGGTPFQDQFNKGLDNLSKGAEKTKELGAAAIHTGEEVEKSFDESSVSGLLGKLNDLRKQQDDLPRGPSGSVLDPERFEKLGKQIEDAKNQLKELLKLEEERLKVADEQAKTLAKDVQTPQAAFQKNQQDQFRKHMDERHALQIKANAARASGDDATAKAIDEQLAGDTFRQDQAQEAGERQLELNRDIYSTPAGESDQFSTPRGEADQFNQPESELRGIYGRKADTRASITGGRTDPGSIKIYDILVKIYQQWQ